MHKELIGLDLHNSPFVIMTVVGQELLAVDLVHDAIRVLELALRVDSNSLKLKLTVLSTLSLAYWKLNDHKKAAEFMHQDLNMAIELGK